MDFKTFLQHLCKHQHPVMLKDGIFTGKGASLLQTALREYPCFVVGEEHGIAEIPQLVASLFQIGYDEGYRHLCVEISPLMAKKATHIISNDGFPEFQHIIKENPLLIPFYGWAEDAQLLETVFKLAPQELHPYLLWGLDQEFLFSTEYLLKELLTMTSHEATRAIVNDLILKGQELQQANIPSMFALQGVDLTPLKVAYEAHPDALDIVVSLEKSFRIYHHYFRGSQGELDYFYYNNLDRERLMKVNFAHYYRDAQKQSGSSPKVMLRFGETHASRGLSRTKVYSLTNFVAELAEFDGHEIFNILIIAGQGTQTRSIEGVHQAEFITKEWLQPLVDVAIKEDWALFDFRPLRPILSSQIVDELSSQLEALFWRYDALLILNNSSPASPIAQ